MSIAITFMAFIAELIGNPVMVESCGYTVALAGTCYDFCKEIMLHIIWTAIAPVRTHYKRQQSYNTMQGWPFAEAIGT